MCLCTLLEHLKANIKGIFVKYRLYQFDFAENLKTYSRTSSWNPPVLKNKCTVSYYGKQRLFRECAHKITRFLDLRVTQCNL